MSIVSAIDILHAAIDGLSDEIALYRVASIAGTENVAADELAVARDMDVLRVRHAASSAQLTNVQLASRATLTPTTFRGGYVIGSSLVPAFNKHDPRGQLSYEVERTIPMLVYVAELQKQFATAESRMDQNKLGAARTQLARFGHRPIELAFMRAALSSVGLWRVLDAPGTSPLGGALDPSPFGEGARRRPWESTSAQPMAR
jgi:hypothetical protein